MSMSKKQKNNIEDNVESNKDTEVVEQNEPVVLTKKEKTKKIVNICVTVFECLVVVFLIMVSVLTMASGTKAGSGGVSKDPITGISYFPVLSDSMAPTFKKGDLVIGKQINDAQKHELATDEEKGEGKGAIITYYTNNAGSTETMIVTHRLLKKEQVTETIHDVEYTTWRFYTRGDAEEKIESKIMTVEAGNIIAVYKGHLDGVGNVITAFQKSSALMFCVIVLPLILLFVWNGYSFVKIIFNNKKEVALEVQEKKHAEERAQILEEARKQALEEFRKEQEKADKPSKKEDKKE